MPDDTKKIAEKLKGKKAKVKKLDDEVTGTKAKKLPKDVQADLEEIFGAKLGKVRVHSGGNATEICKKLNAKAFTVGTDIYFAKGGFAADKALIAHELTHVLQQTKGKINKAEKGKAYVSK